MTGRHATSVDFVEEPGQPLDLVYRKKDERRAVMVRAR